MELKALREEVLEANLALVRSGLVIFTFGNAMGYDAASDRVDAMRKPERAFRATSFTPADLVMTDLQGEILAGSTLRPSSDLPTHLALYQAFPGVHGVVHTHSRYATSWAQAGVEIPCLGTTHADYFPSAIPVTPPMKREEIQNEYEWNTGQVIIRRFTGVDPLVTTAVLVNGHAPFCWGKTVTDAAHTAEIVEESRPHGISHGKTIKADVAGLPDLLRDKHFLRKHGPGAFYGQDTAIKS